MSAMPIILATILLIFAPLNTITLTSAEVTDLDVPPWVVQGDTLSISGKASAGEVVWINSSFEISLPVSDGEYYDEFIGIDFPEGEKNFSVIAKNIKNITVSLPSPVEGETVTITCSGKTMTITVSGAEIEYPLEKSIDETDAVEFSVSLPKLIEISPLLNITLDIIGKKDIKISGDAADNATSVSLNVGMSIKVTAGSEGDFTVDIDTEGVPPGEFLITAGGIEKTVEVLEESAEPTPTPTPSPTPSSDGGDGSGDGDGTPDTTPTPSPTPTSTSTPTITLAPTATPAAASPTVTPASPAPATVTPSPSPTPTPSPSASPTQRWIPSFEAVFAIAGLLAVAYLVLRKRE